jgi:tetratricopeptide (TPR) repeat protein
MVTRIFLCDERTEPDIRLYIKEAMEDIAQGDRYIITWSCSNVQSIKVGDQAYFQRVGFAPEGYFAHGRVVAADREYQLRLKYPRYRDLSEAYDIDFYPNNFRVWVAWDSCVDYDRPLPIDELRKKSQFRGAFFDAPDSGVVFKEQYVPRLDRAWDRHSLNSARQGKGIRLVDIYYAWAQEDSQQGFTEEALDNYALAIETQSDYIRAYIGRGNLYYGLKEFDNAIADYTAATAIRSKLAKLAFYQRAQTYSKLGQYDKAAADYNEALQIDFEYPEAHFGLANAFFKLKEYEKSIASYTQALNLNPANDQAYYRRGRGYFILKQLNEAIADYTKALEFKPDYADAFYYRAVAYSQPELGRDRLAIADLEKAAQLYREQSRLDRYDRAADLLETIEITAKERAKVAQSAQATPTSARRSPPLDRSNPAASRSSGVSERQTANPGKSTRESKQDSRREFRREISANQPTRATSYPPDGSGRSTARPRAEVPTDRNAFNASEAPQTPIRAVEADQAEPEIKVAQYMPSSPEEVWGNDDSASQSSQSVTQSEQFDRVDQFDQSDESIAAIGDRSEPGNITAVEENLFGDRFAQMDGESMSEAAIDNASVPLSDSQIDAKPDSQADLELANPASENWAEPSEPGDPTDLPEGPTRSTEEMPEVAIAMPASSAVDSGLEADEAADQEEQEDDWQFERSELSEQAEQSEWSERSDKSEQSDDQSDQFSWLERELMADNAAIATSQTEANQFKDQADRLDQADYAEGYLNDESKNLSDNLIDNLTETATSAQSIAIDNPLPHNPPASDREISSSDQSLGDVQSDRQIETAVTKSSKSPESAAVTKSALISSATETLAERENRTQFADFADFEDELPIRSGSYDAIERAALVIITSQYIRDGWMVRSVEKSKRGYDLACRKDGVREDVSVRGVAGRQPAFELNADEIREAEYNNNFVLWVVSSALGNYACQRWLGKEVLADFDLKPTNFVAKPKT